MSYSEILTVNGEGDVEGALELRNGHGSGPMIWSALCRKYGDKIYTDSGFLKPRPMIMDQWSDLWKASQDGRVELRWWEHNVLHWTYDNAMLKGEDIETFIASCRMFWEAHAIPGYVCHLPATADFLAALLEKGERPRAICLYGTSVSENPWSVRNGDDDYRRYNIDRDTKHWFVEIRGKDWVKPAAAISPSDPDPAATSP